MLEANNLYQEVVGPAGLPWSACDRLLRQHEHAGGRSRGEYVRGVHARKTHSNAKLQSASHDENKKLWPYVHNRGSKPTNSLGAHTCVLSAQAAVAEALEYHSSVTCLPASFRCKQQYPNPTALRDVGINPFSKTSRYIVVENHIFKKYMRGHAGLLSLFTPKHENRATPASSCETTTVARLVSTVRM